ncbi:hypothetical protein [Bradyrhizobium sp. LMTR 3]|uniref:hypothetical protein n=1 Tax=Bradyrhizobium sp. LMTR 3 TaxID=189873 RepID=UPI0008104B26|nr:hypothetical protein [Bradyrhizobium sp. LMTR 3]OCK55328.1 hypothetical protein LMTR3_10885 [Bradyrhizobium sp. LMTR 3]
MHAAILGLAAGVGLLVQASDQVPKLDVAATCRGSVDADKAMGLALPQSFDKCMSDEHSAQQQLAPIWSRYSASIQARCHGEAAAAGNESYVDLLVCLQMTDGPNAASAISLVGASKKRRPN